LTDEHPAITEVVRNIENLTGNSTGKGASIESRVFGAIAAAGKPGRVAVVSRSVAGPWFGWRAQRLSRLILESALAGFEVRVLVDITLSGLSSNSSGARALVEDGVPKCFAHLLVPYANGDVLSYFWKIAQEKGAVADVARAKYYETLAYSWWYGQRAAVDGPALEWLWGMEDDVHFTGSWAGFFHSIRLALRNGTDLVLFDDYCPPGTHWMWNSGSYAKDKPFLRSTGKVLAGQVMFFGASARFLERDLAKHLAGESGHVEWWIPTLALSEELHLAFVSHERHGRSTIKGRLSPTLSKALVGRCEAVHASEHESPLSWFGTYRLPLANHKGTDAKKYYDLWRQKNSTQCDKPLLLHPVKCADEKCDLRSAKSMPAAALTLSSQNTTALLTVDSTKREPLR